MADRKSPQTEPVLDNTAGEEPDRILRSLPQPEFFNVIRWIKTHSVEEVGTLRNVTFHALGRLGAKRDLNEAFGRIPRGSDQSEVQSIIRWVEGIQPGDTESIEQLVVIDATCVLRSR